MRWLDPKFKKNRVHYLLQSLMALLVILVMTLFIDVFIQTTIIASFGATVFIVFTMPHKNVSRYRYLFGGYTIAIVVGELCSRLMVLDLQYIESYVFALAVGVAMFLMVVTNTEHPPAAALAMGIAIEGADFMTVVVIYTSLIIVFIFRRLMNRWLIDLM